MGGNSGNGYRNGPVKDRKQVYNPKSGQYVKINTETGQFMSSKSTPYKGVREENKKQKKVSK